MYRERREAATLDLKLLVQYHGIKATQYFAKFTPESQVILREDLLTLKLPLPKRDNTTFVSHGIVECFWPAAQKNGVLHKHLLYKADKDSDTMKQLSIAKLSLKEIFNDGAKPNKLKRPNPYAEPSHPKVPYPFKKRAASPKSPIIHGSRVSTTSNNDQRDPQRPTKFARIEKDDVSTWSTKPPRFTNPPNSVNDDMQSNGTTPKTPSSNVSATAYRRDSVSSALREPPPSFREPWSLDYERTWPHEPNPILVPDRNAPTAPSAMRQDGWPKKPPSTVVHAVKEEPSDTPIPAFQPSPPKRLNSREHAVDQGSVSRPQGPQHQGSSISTPIRNETDEASDKEKGDILVQDFLKSLKLKTESQNASPVAPLWGQPSVFSFQNTLAPDVQQTQTLNSGSSPIPWDTVAAALFSAQGAQSSKSPINASTWLNTAHVPPPQGQEQHTTMAPSVLPTPPPSAPFLALTSSFSVGSTSSKLFQLQQHRRLPASSSSGSAPNDPSLIFVPPTPCTSSASSPPPALVKTIQMQARPVNAAPTQAQPQLQVLPENQNQNQSNIMLKKGGHYSSHESPARPRVVDSDVVVIQRLTREAWDIKRQVSAQVAREAAIISELKARNSTWLPEPMKFGVDPSADMKEQLTRLQNELAEEKRLRQEAENVIMDIRRECRAPFVVPSLLDAFVQISKLTTRATHPVSATPRRRSAEGPETLTPRVTYLDGAWGPPQPATGFGSWDV